jgi:hypothetical protein
MKILLLTNNVNHMSVTDLCRLLGFPMAGDLFLYRSLTATNNFSDLLNKGHVSSFGTQELDLLYIKNIA